MLMHLHVCSAGLPQPTYQVMPDGRYKPVHKESEQAKPQVIKLNMPSKQNKRRFSATAPGAAAQPAYLKVCLMRS